MAQDEQKPTFSLRPIATPDLNADFSNLGEITILKFRQALEGPHGREVIERAIDELHRITQEGSGISSSSLPAPLRQSALECQTMALLNGVQAWIGPEKVRPLLSQVGDIRRAAIASRQGAADAAFSMEAVDEELTRRGILKQSGRSGNPLQTARLLFSGHRFMGLASTARFHAVTILPLQYNSERPDDFALEVDSLGGTQRVISAEEFLYRIVNKPLDESQIIYSVI